MSQEAKWYVVHTYSGYENKVKEDLEKSVENLDLQDTILEVKYPTEEAIEILPNGKRKVTQRKVYPGYVMVKMLVDVVEKERPPEKGGGVVNELVMNPRAWYVVRNTRGVTGFVGPGSKPVPLSGPLENFIGRVEHLDAERQKVKLTVSMFGRETPVELDFVQVQKL